MRVSASKAGKLSAAIISAAMLITISAPAHANIPSGAYDGAQDFISNGQPDKIFGSGSDTTYTMQQQLSDIFNRAPGCILQNPVSANQDFDMACDAAINATAGKAPGFGNYDRDLAVEYHFIGSGGGRNHVVAWNNATSGTVQANYFRSSSIADAKDLRYVAFAKDALAAFKFNTVAIGGAAVDTPAKNITKLSQNQIKKIWNGDIKCWASIDKSVSPIANEAGFSNYLTSGAFDEAKWATAVATAVSGSGYTADSEAYKACVPIAVYTVPTTSGTRSAWDSLAATGSGKGAGFTSVIDPFTGAVMTGAEVNARTIPENNATPIADRLATQGINTDLVKNAIYFFSVGRYSASVGGPEAVTGNPVISGNSTGKTDFSDSLFQVVKTANEGAMTLADADLLNKVNISAGSYALTRSLYFGYQYPNQATRNLLDPVNGFLCSSATENMTDPITSKNVRAEIRATIEGSGFIEMSKAAVGGGRTGTSYCRQDARSTNTANNDSSAPTVGPDGSNDVTNPLRPVFKLRFNELVAGVTADTLGLQDVTVPASPTTVASTLKCFNARQAEIPCLEGISTSNWDLSPLQFVQSVTVTPNADLTRGNSYKVVAKGTGTLANPSAQTLAITDRHGLVDWPINDATNGYTGNTLVEYSSDAYVAPKADVTISLKKTSGATVSLGSTKAAAITLKFDSKFATVALANSATGATLGALTFSATCSIPAACTASGSQVIIKKGTAPIVTVTVTYAGNETTNPASATWTNKTVKTLVAAKKVAKLKK